MPAPPRPPPPDSAAWLAHMLATTRDYAVIMLQPDGTIADWLGAAENVFGYRPDEAIGQPFGSLFTPEDRDASLDRQEMAIAAASGRSDDDRWHLRKGGLRFWGNGILHAVRDPQGALAGYCKVLRDRSDLRTQLDDQLHRLERQAQQLEHRQRFMVRLGHELRNPLAPIRAAAYTIQRLGDEKLKRPCEVLDRQIDLMVRLLDDLAEATRADVRVSRILPQPVQLEETLQLAAAGCQAALAAKGQRLDVVAPDAPITFEADPARLQQMLLNLLGNATKYTPEGGHVTLSATLEADMVVIHVEDDGPGIADEVMPHLFELFARGSGDAPQEGLGVGLAVVKELATLHGGGVTVRSAAGGGAVFTLRLPLRQPLAPVAALPEPRPSERDAV